MQFRRWSGLTVRGVAACVGLGVFLFYVNRMFAPLPLYAGDEGAYLIRALYTLQLESDPDRYAMLQPVDNTLYFFVIRLVDALSLNVLPWMRLIGAASYLAGLALLFRAAGAAFGRGPALGALLVALAFPYYRFVFTAMPEGPFIGLLCLAAWTLFATFRTRPALGAALLGVLTALLVLIKPHGLVAAPAFALLCLVDAAIGRPPLRSLILRLALFALALMATGMAVRLAGGADPAQALFFFGSSFYARQLSHAAAPDAAGVAGVALLAMGSLCAILMAVPVIAGLRAPLAKLRDRGEGALSPIELAFLFVLLCAAGTVAMVAIYSFKIAGIASETHRLWGRYFEFYAPMLWLLAAGPAAAGLKDRRLRALMAGVVVAGALGLLAALPLGVQLYPWDGTAVEAFAAPDLVPFPFGQMGGARLLAFLATGAVAGATLLGRSSFAWAAYFVALGLLSTRADDAWGGDLATRSRAIERELHVAEALTRGARTLVIASDINDGHVAFLRLDGRARVAVTALAPKPKLTAGFTRLVVMRDREVPGPWTRTYAGEALSVYELRPEAGR